MNYLSTFSGIEAASVAWEPLGWTPVGFSEIEPFASAVLAHRFPRVTNYGDITKHAEWDLGAGAVDLLVGGSPCQAFSVAGLRRGLDDPRGQLTLVYLQLAARLEPEWIVWENVPGVLSSDGGRSFGAFLGGLAELGYGFAYRVLDARHFGVPQRRRRVFLVARRAGDWQSCAKVLLEPAGLPGNPPSGGETWQAPTRAVADGARASGSWWDGSDFAATLTKQNANGAQRMPDKGNFGAVVIDRAAFNQGTNAAYEPRIEASEEMSALVARGPHAVAYRKSRRAQSVDDHETWVADDTANTLNGFDVGDVRTTHAVAHAFYSTGGSHGLEPHPNICPPLKVGSALGIPSPPAISYTIDMQACKGNANIGDGTVSPTLCKPSGSDVHAVAITNHVAATQKAAMVVRRLTPVECERLQGFPDKWTDIPYRGKPAPDGPRYKALGNSMAVPCMRWIGERIKALEEGRL